MLKNAGKDVHYFSMKAVRTFKFFPEMPKHPFHIVAFLRSQSGLMFRQIRIPVFFLIVLLFAAAPVFSQDAEETDGPGTEIVEQSEGSGDGEEKEENISAASENNAAEEPASSDQSAEPEKAVTDAVRQTRAVLLLFPFTSSYAEHVSVSDAVSKHVASLGDSFVVMQK